MKMLVEWTGLSEETKQTIIADAEIEKQDANKKLKEYMEKFKNDRSLRRKIIRAVGKISPNFEFGIECLSALASYFPFGYKVLKKEPLCIEFVIEDDWFEMLKDLPMGSLIFGRLFKKKKVAKDMKERCEYYGIIKTFSYT